MATILPFKGWRTYNEERNRIRLTVNQWIRENKEADGYIEFDGALQDTSDTYALSAPYASADKLHPSTEGAQKMAQSIPSELFLG